ncbi:MAG: DegT/DnrJ/EryC1/StrS family aminotransferase [Candidatus Doudnabacteria bacterium]
MQIPFFTLKRQYRIFRKEINSILRRVFQKDCFILGPEVEQFEEEFARYIGVKFAIGVASGTDALTLSLKVLGIGKDDEVITVANTAQATAAAISQINAKPVFVDIDPTFYTLNPDLLKKHITPKTRAIIPVHLYGQSCNLAPILKVAKKYKLAVIEDACQAHGAKYKGKKVGGFGITGCFSFYPTKNLGAYGDGGMIVTNQKKIAERLKMLRFYGRKERDIYTMKGTNSRLDELQAAILRFKLKHLDSFNQQRMKHANLYSKLLRNVPQISLPQKPKYGYHIYHLYVIRCQNDRDGFKKHLESKGIQTLIHYPVPIHLQKAYKELEYKKGDLPITEECATTILSLPLFPELKEKEIIYITNAIKSYFH